MPFLYILAAVLGLSVAMQGTTNGQLSGRLGLPLTLVLNSGFVFTGSLIWYLVALANGNTPSGRPPAPWYLFTGGVFGFLIISCAAVTYPKLGAGTTITIAVATQVIAALVIDHFGATGRHVPLSTQRVAGVAFVAIGTWMVVNSHRG